MDRKPPSMDFFGIASAGRTVDEEMSCRAAAARFGRAVDRDALARPGSTGRPCCKGRHALAAAREAILARYEACRDITLDE